MDKKLTITQQESYKFATYLVSLGWPGASVPWPRMQRRAEDFRFIGTPYQYFLAQDIVQMVENGDF